MGQRLVKMGGGGGGGLKPSYVTGPERIILIAVRNLKERRKRMVRNKDRPSWGSQK